MLLCITTTAIIEPAEVKNSSKIGIQDEMEYKGNTYLKEFVGYDAT